MVKMGGPVRKLASFVYESELNDGQKQTNIEKKTTTFHWKLHLKPSLPRNTETVKFTGQNRLP